jgi:hypothetical protein
MDINSLILLPQFFIFFWNMITLTFVLPLFKHSQSKVAQGKLQYNVNIPEVFKYIRILYIHFERIICLLLKSIKIASISLF